MKQRILFLLLVCFLPLYLKAQSPAVQNLIRNGWNAAYSMDFENAEDIFLKIIEIDKDLPYGYYNIARLHFWLYLGSNDPGEYFTFLKYSELAVDKIQKQLEKHPDKPKYNFLAGNIELLRAMAHAMNNNVLDAFWESKNAKMSFDKTLEADSTYYDAYMGLGLLDYALGYVPGIFKWAVNLTGLSSDKECGLKYLLLSYKKGHANKTEKEFHLAKIYTDYLADYDSASIYLRLLLNKYPNNTLFLYQNALTNIKARKLDRAENSLNQIIKINNRKISVINSLAHFRIGEVYFRKNNFRRAKAEYEKFIEMTKDFDFVGMANYKIALCNSILDSTIDNQKYFEGAKTGSPDIFEDSYAKSRSEKFMDKGFSRDYLFLIKMQNYLESAKYRTVYDSLKAYYIHIEDESNRAKGLAFLAESCLHLEMYADAVKFIEKIDSLDYSAERWLKPYSLYLRAKADYLIKERSRASFFLNEAEKSNDYEFKSDIQALIDNLRRKLKRK